jgi:hypothetical protein
MIKIFITLLLFSASFSTYASSRWTPVSQNNSGDIFFVDENSIQISGDVMTFWYRVNFKQRDKFGNLSSKIQISINCKTRERASRFALFYEELNNNGKVTFNSVGKNQWDPIPPESTTYHMFSFVC